MEEGPQNIVLIFLSENQWKKWPYHYPFTQDFQNFWLDGKHFRYPVGVHLLYRRVHQESWLYFTFQKVAEEVARLHDEFYTNKTLQEMAKVSTLQKLGSKYYSDSDLVDTLPRDLKFNTWVWSLSCPSPLKRKFKQKLGLENGEGDLINFSVVRWKKQIPMFLCLVEVTLNHHS